MSARIFVGAETVAAIPADDRGIAYGDGLFETMRAHRGTVPWWDAHWARLVRGASRLRIALPDEQQVLAESERLLDGGDGVIKLIVSRGAGGRGYAPGTAMPPTWVLSSHAVPMRARRTGVAMVQHAPGDAARTGRAETLQSARTGAGADRVG
jgi:4-amino-4-deoxychorismate lyase